MRKGDRLRVAMLGATGTVGQRFVQLLSAHPWFEIVRLCASERSQGLRYAEACRWQLASDLPEHVAAMPLEDVAPREGVAVVFSALSASVAQAVELDWARSGVAVFSNAGAHRLAPDVPLVIPEVNGEHLELIALQRKGRGFTGRGCIVTNANCSTTFLAMALAPLESAFGVRRVSVATLQAVSGAGYPGLASMDILGNVIPHIPGEEAKIERETQKILGRLEKDHVELAAAVISAQVDRVPVQDGHMESVSIELDARASLEDIRELLAGFRGEPQERGLPSAPARPIVVVDEADRPQPRLDLYRERGMATVVGRLRPGPVLHFKMSLLGHNTLRGASGGSVLNAELAVARGLIGSAP